MLVQPGKYSERYILPADQHPWMSEHTKIYTRLHSFCNKQNIGFIQSFSEESIRNAPTKKLLGALMWDLLMPVEKWRELNEVCKHYRKKLWFVTDCLIDPSLHEFSNIKILSYFQLLGAATCHTKQIETITHPKKLYNCFIQRVDSVRQTWFYFLHLNRLLDEGYVSFLLWQLEWYSNLRGLDLFDYVHHHHGLDKLSHFDRAYKELRSMVPYKNFAERDLISYIKDSKYSLILETYAVDDDRGQWCFTEKLVRSLQVPTINLPFIQKHAIKKLRGLGLIVPNILDEIDDKIWEQRQQSLLNILINDLIDWDYQQNRDMALHNFSLLERWQFEYRQEDFFDDLFKEIALS